MTKQCSKAINDTITRCANVSRWWEWREVLMVDCTHKQNITKKNYWEGKAYLVSIE